MMKKIDFQTLLTDLFLLYNPSKIDDVNFLIEKYTGQELDAIQMVYIKYNFKNHPYYNPNVTEEFLMGLIESYNKKDRVLSQENIEKNKPVQHSLNEEEIAKKIAEEKAQEHKKLVEEIESNLRRKISQEFEGKTEKNPLTGFEIKVSNYSASEVVLPDPKILLAMGVGGKIICRNTDRKFISLCIEDITMDFVTDTEKPTIEVIINEAKMS